MGKEGKIEKFKAEPKEKSKEKFQAEFEEELSPEVMEKIMEKVEDVDSRGISYTILQSWRNKDLKTLKNILKEGLKGTRGRRYPGDFVGGSDAKNPDWFYFNVTGHTPLDIGYDDSCGEPELVFAMPNGYDKDKLDKESGVNKTNPSESEIDYSYWFQGERDVIALLFDINSSGNGWEVNWKDKEDYFQREKIAVDDEHGIMGNGKVSPIHFKGIMLKTEDKDNMQKALDSIVSTMRKTYKNDKDLFIPIYDRGGNLLWPKEMDHEEIKKSVETKTKKIIDPLSYHEFGSPSGPYYKVNHFFKDAFFEIGEYDDVADGLLEAAKIHLENRGVQVESIKFNPCREEFEINGKAYGRNAHRDAHGHWKDVLDFVKKDSSKK